MKKMKVRLSKQHEKRALRAAVLVALLLSFRIKTRPYGAKERNMRETILLVHFTDLEKRKKLTRALLPLGLRIKEVDRADYDKSVGVLVGQKGIVQEETATDEERFRASSVRQGHTTEEEIERELSGELLLMAGLSSQRVDQVLRAIRKAGLSLPYKAVLTAANQSWNVWKLFQEIKEEHQKMSGEGD